MLYYKVNLLAASDIVVVVFNFFSLATIVLFPYLLFSLEFIATDGDESFD